MDTATRNRFNSPQTTRLQPENNYPQSQFVLVFPFSTYILDRIQNGFKPTFEPVFKAYSVQPNSYSQQYSYSNPYFRFIFKTYLNPYRKNNPGNGSGSAADIRTLGSTESHKLSEHLIEALRISIPALSLFSARNSLRFQIPTLSAWASS